MIVHVQLFARFRDAFGMDATPIELDDAATVGTLRTAVAQLKPEIAGLLARSQVAVNGEFAPDEIRLASQDEIALIPPVSGG